VISLLSRYAPAWIQSEFRPARYLPSLISLPASGDFSDSPKNLSVISIRRIRTGDDIPKAQA